VSKLLACCFIALLFIGYVSSSISLASDEESGNLEINVEALHDSGEVADNLHRSIGHEVAPTLFLEQKTQAEDTRRQRSVEQLELVQEQMFLDVDTDSGRSGFSTEQAVAQLFAEESVETVRVASVAQNFESAIIPRWVIVLFVVFGIGFAAMIGITLGKRFSYILHTSTTEGDLE